MFKAIVTTTIVSRHDTNRLIQFPVEIPEAETLADVRSMLLRDGLLMGDRVSFDFLPDNRRMVTDRIPQIVTLAGIASLAPCPYEYFETDEVGANE